MATEEVRSLLDLIGDLKHHAEEHNQIDASHEEDDGYKACLELDSRGFKFVPCDGQLIVHFLKPKVDNRPLPNYLIKEVILYDSNPMILSERYKPIENTWYFFTLIKRKYLNCGVANRNANNGYWKSTGGEVLVSFKNVKVGCKRTLVFYEGERRGRKTNWIMHEYRLADPEKDPNDKRLDAWVLCKLYLRTKKSVSKRINDIGKNNDLVDVVPVLLQPNSVVENGGQIPNFTGQLRRNTEDVTFNTPKRQKFGSNDTMFDDSTLLSQQLKQNTNINSFLYAADNVTTSSGIAKNNDAWSKTPT